MILLLRIKEVNICQFFRRFFSLKKLLNKGKDKPINLMIDIFWFFFYPLFVSVKAFQIKYKIP